MPDKNIAKTRLEAISRVLLDTNPIPSVLLKAVHDLTDLFEELGAYDANSDNFSDNPDIFTPQGKAISTANAARCAWEYQRTAKFLQGVYAGIREAQRRFPGQRIEVLYAGTGPYATLAMPLLPFFSAEELGFTFIDLNPRNLDWVSCLLDSFGFGGFATAFHTCDATLYRHPPEQPLHMLVTETMLNALAKEPQVAITLNLAPQLVEGGILIPERIEIEAALADPRREISVCDESGQTQKRLRVDLGRIFELSRGSVAALPFDADHQPVFEWTGVSIPEARPASADHFLLLTTITTFGDIRLEDYECSLSCPMRLKELHHPEPGTVIEFRYRIGEKPGFEYRCKP